MTDVRHDKAPSVACRGWMVTLGLMMAAWVPFRCGTLHQTWVMWGRMLDPRAYLHLTLLLDRYVTAMCMLAMMLVAYAIETRVLPVIEQRPAVLTTTRVGYYACLFAFVFVFLQVRTQFIYFQF